MSVEGFLYGLFIGSNQFILDQIIHMVTTEVDDNYIMNLAVKLQQLFDSYLIRQKKHNNQCVIINGFISEIVLNRYYVLYPVSISNKVWVKYDKMNATDECLIRGCIAGYMKTERFLLYVARLCMMTHSDERCVASCITLAYVIHSILYYQDRIDNTHMSIPIYTLLDVISNGINRGLIYLEKHQVSEYFRFTNSSFEGLYLDHPTDGDYVLRSLGCCLWVVRELWRMEVHDQMTCKDEMRNRIVAKVKKHVRSQYLMPCVLCIIGAYLSFEPESDIVDFIEFKCKVDSLNLPYS